MQATDPVNNGDSYGTAKQAADSAEKDDVIRGRWGECTEGGGVNVAASKAEWTQLSRRMSTRSQLQAGQQKQTSAIQAGSSSSSDTAVEEEAFDLASMLRGRKAAMQEEGIETEKPLGVTWRNLTVKGVGSTASFVHTLDRAILASFGPNLLNVFCEKFPYIGNKIPGRKVAVRNLIEDFNGSLKDEMLLVLGSPGSGCSTFLKSLTNQRGSFLAVEGDVNYAGIDAKSVDKKFRGEVVCQCAKLDADTATNALFADNQEDDQHFPTLTVSQTLRFALKNKVPARRPNGESRASFVNLVNDVLLKMFGISHTANTVVGDAMIRGVSGGERKRVSIAETLIGRSSIASWDGSTRGLDSTTALDFVRSLRVLTDISRKTSIATLYQAGEGIYDLFDKVLVIDAGRCIYFGPAKDARQYFHDLGYLFSDRQTTADALTSVTDAEEVRYREGFEKKAPRTAEERAKAFKESSRYRQNEIEIEEAQKEFEQANLKDQLKKTVRQEKSKAQPKGSSYTVSFPSSVWALTIRQAQIKLGDPSALIIKTLTNMVVALILGAMFYQANRENTSASMFTRGGALFFSLLFLGWLNLSDVYEAVQGRPIIQRHRAMAFYRPSAVSLAQLVVDVPSVIFSVIFYFMSGFQRSASRFFIYLLFVVVSTFNLTTFFRAVAALSPNFDTGIRFCVIGLNVAVLFVGYVIPRENIPSWFRWISYVQPISYSFEALLANEFTNTIFTCISAQIVPQVAGAAPENQSCAVVGSTPGSLLVDGGRYIADSYGYTRAHLWRNFGICIAFSIAYIGAAALFTELFDLSGSGGAATVFIRSKRAKQSLATAARPADEESGAKTACTEKTTYKEQNGAAAKLDHSASILTFKDVCYTVPTAGGPKLLLDKVTGLVYRKFIDIIVRDHKLRAFVTAGSITALMGASGAGKTTLLTTLSLRHNPSQVDGEILVNGKAPTAAFARETGYAEQMDTHDETATVRESLEFSALLRQSRSVSREDKLVKVDDVMQLLGLESLSDAVIGSLSVEEKKRVTIGVELSANPSLLLFLDEPTSGLSSEGALQIGRFLKKLANSGQACLCTIHQPSSVLLQEYFDRLLLLSKGGRTAYHGDISGIQKYFESKGARKADVSENIAEYAVEIVNAPGPDGRNWADIWNESEECQHERAAVDKIVLERSGEKDETDPALLETYATSLTEQTKLLTLRVARHMYRDSSYGYGKLFTVTMVAIFNGFAFYRIGRGPKTQNELQQAAFSVFLIILVIPALLNASIPKHFVIKSLWKAREKYSRTYSWIALVTALLVNEVPYAIIAAVVYWLIWYWVALFPIGEQAGYSFLICLLVMLFVPSFAHGLCAVAQSPSFVANTLPFFLAILSLVTGIIVPYSQLNYLYRYFVYYANPIVWFIRGQVATLLHNLPVQCSDQELVIFQPPAGQTCQAYAGSATPGYLQNPNANANANCAYCQYSVGDDFSSSLNARWDEKWTYLGVLLCYCVSNVVLCYLFFYLFQIRKPSGRKWSILSIFRKVKK